MFENLFRPARARARETAPESKAYAAPLIALSLAGRPNWMARDYASLAQLGVMQNAIAYRCVRMIAEGAASVPFLLYEGEQEIEEHPLLALLSAPNPRQSGVELFERWYGFLQCAGDSYLQAITLNGQVRELYTLRPDRVTAVPGPQGWPIAYDYSVNGQTMRISSANGFLPVLHTALFHPLSEMCGLSPLEAAQVPLDIHNAGAAWTKSLLDNAARPSGALVYKGPDGQPGLTDEQFRRLKNELEDAYQGASNAGRPMVLEGGLEWRAMSFAPSDMDFSDLRNAAAREIALAFGVPPMLLGIPGDNTFSNYAQANLSFWRQTILPLVARTSQALTKWLGPQFGVNLRIGYDVDSVNALADERAGLWEKLNTAAFLTINEKRAAAGYSPLDGGDAFPGAAP
jgi:HK97 family phage portal protein